MANSIFRLVSKKSSPFAYTIIVALVFILVAFAVYVSYQTQHEKRIEATIVYLKALRTSIQVFYNYNGLYPDSLDEFRQWQHAGDIWQKMYVDLTSEKQSDIPEYRELNDKGGYYYDPNSGEIRLNLTRPVKEYLKWYVGRFKDEVPSSW